MDAVAVSQLDCFAAGVLFARTEGIVPAPEPTHALAEIVRIVNECKATGETKVLLTALCGHGHFDLAACVPQKKEFHRA
jgi:tryptophan synthase beta chain